MASTSSTASSSSSNSSSSSLSPLAPASSTFKHPRDSVEETDETDDLHHTKREKKSNLTAWDALRSTTPRLTLLSIDVESVGLVGTSFGYAHTLVDKATRKEVERFIVYGDYKQTQEYADYRALLHELKVTELHEDDPRTRVPWIEKHVIPAIPSTCVILPTLREFREAAWNAYQSVMQRAKECTGTPPLVMAENGFPVEAKFFIDCIRDDVAKRQRQAPFPLHEVCTWVHSFRLSEEQLQHLNRREPDELPRHNPYADARQSLRIWMEAETVGKSRVVKSAAGDIRERIANAASGEESVALFAEWIARGVGNTEEFVELMSGNKQK